MCKFYICKCDMLKANSIKQANTARICIEKQMQSTASQLLQCRYLNRMEYVSWTVKLSNACIGIGKRNKRRNIGKIQHGLKSNGLKSRTSTTKKTHFWVHNYREIHAVVISERRISTGIALPQTQIQTTSKCAEVCARHMAATASPGQR